MASQNTISRWLAMFVSHLRYVVLYFFLTVGAFCSLMFVSEALEFHGKVLGIIVAGLFILNPLVAKREKLLLVFIEGIFASRREYHSMLLATAVALFVGLITVWFFWFDFVEDLLIRKVLAGAGGDFEQIVSFSLMIAVPVVTLRYIFFLVECANTAPPVSDLDAGQS